MQKRLKQAFCSLKEHSAVSYARIATVGGFCDFEQTIVKATAPDDLPLNEKYIQELLKAFSISPTSFQSFAIFFTRRFSKTHCWKVALKCLLLLHRLLRAVTEDSPLRRELLYQRSSGNLSLSPCLFQDESSSNPEDYTMFVRSYAMFLDEAIECFCIAFKSTSIMDPDEMPIMSLKDKMKLVEKMLEVLPQLQSLIDKAIDCRPDGVAAKSFIVQSAMKLIIRDSFNCYATFRKEVVLLLDNLFQMPYRSCIAAFGIYKKAALQANQLCEFYDWCKQKWLCGPYEYPYIERIPDIQVRALESFLNGMWQFTESSTSPNSSPSSWVESNSSLTESDSIVAVSPRWEKTKFEENGYSKRYERTDSGAAITLKMVSNQDNDNWEALLEASLEQISLGNNCINIPRNNFNIPQNMFVNQGEEEDINQWQIQVCDPNYNYNNPFYQPNYCVPVLDARNQACPLWYYCVGHRYN